MSKTIKLSNGILSVEIATLGAEILSVQKDGFENMWGADPKIWCGHAPILFPICGRLKDNKYTFGGKEYEMGMHGFARKSEFTVESASDTSATFLLTANEETLAMYPFTFEFRAKYTLDENKLIVEYITKNTDNKKMYYSVGSHEAYACPEGIEEYSLVFDNPEDLENSLLTCPLLNHTHDNDFGVTDELPLKYRQFDIDTLIFEKLKTKKVTLKNRKSGRQISVYFDDADILCIWTIDKAGYLCIEPWNGAPDFVDTNGDITKKAYIIELEPNVTDSKKHIIEF